MNGVIWSKTQKTFVPIFSVSAYHAAMQRERFRRSRALEIYNFQSRNLTLTSFQEPNFLEFYDDDTKISGFCGEIWNLLAESLNFTLQPIRVNMDSVGAMENNTYKRGLLSIILRNETTIVPKVELYSQRLVATDFTIPLWMSSHRLYVRHEVIYDNTWMAKIFCWELWCLILIMHILFSTCSFWSQSFLTRIRNKAKSMTFYEHFFYNFGMLCNQSCIPGLLDGKSRILEVSLSLFSYVIYTAFSTLLFTHITKKIFVPPFDDLDSLITDTKYSVVSLKGSTADLVFKTSMQPFLSVKTRKRSIIVSSIEEMFKMACSSTTKKYVLFQGEDEHMAKGYFICHLIPTGKSYLNTWIASGIVKNFKYKRTIDIGILKLKEVGLLEVLKRRWMDKRIKEYTNNIPHSIEMDQVSLVIAVMCCGIVIALIILIIEKIVFVYKLKQS